MPQNRRVQLPDCRVLLRRLSTEEIGNYLAVRDVRIAVNERPNNEAEINIVLPRGNNVNINDIVNPRVNPPRRVLPPRRRHADVPHRVTYRTALLYGAESVENVPISSLGRFQVRCRMCDAKYFAEEACNRQGLYMQCCNLGKVEIPALGPCPEELRGFLTGEDRRTLSFAETSERNVGQGHWCFCISGHVSLHGTGSDTEEACHERNALIRGRVREATIRTIDQMIHGRELHHLLERSSDYAVTAIVSPNGTMNYVADNALLYQQDYDEVIVMAGTNDINDQGVLLRRLSTEEIGNYLAVRDVRIAINERPNNEAEINIVLPRGNNVYINDIVNPRVNPPRRVLPPMRRHADVPHRVTYRSALLYGAESVENVPMSSLGRFQVRCRICDAKYFSEEACNRQGLYMQCCNLGKVEIPALGPCPEELRGFLTGEDRRMLSFAETSER
ncbi:hypothetical protein J6590_092454 [Homalodisca vitripennis]|nr:hypothetical protein J6590_092454 [Homalodisca vitripennis]